MIKIPVRSIPNQRFKIVLNNQNCILHLYQRGDYLYMDLTCDGVEIRRGAICLIDINIPLYKSPHFSGILFFVDMTGGTGIPVYSEIGSRYLLFYDAGVL